jgi:hypothetical protein
LRAEGITVLVGVVVGSSPIYSNGTLILSGDMLDKLPRPG